MSNEEAAVAVATAAAARDDLEAAREVISSLTNQLAVADQAADQVRVCRPVQSLLPAHGLGGGHVATQLKSC